jgi:hypothetical protein
VSVPTSAPIGHIFVTLITALMMSTMSHAESCDRTPAVIYDKQKTEYTISGAFGINCKQSVSQNHVPKHII